MHPPSNISLLLLFLSAALWNISNVISTKWWEQLSLQYRLMAEKYLEWNISLIIHCDGKIKDVVHRMIVRWLEGEVILKYYVITKYRWKLKQKFYMTTIRQAMLYVAECSPTKKHVKTWEFEMDKWPKRWDEKSVHP